tara:strand:- start:354248 stop:355156 length:909 start_codon:yes stop_codon:yes gene_type:complete
MMMSRRKTLLAVAFGAVFLSLSVIYFASRKENPHSVEGFEPMRNDALAMAFAPALHSGAYQKPEKLLYRMSQSPDNLIHIAYFLVWPFERNDTSGFFPWLNRSVYTGGLSLQGLLFGPGDVEVISLIIEPASNAKNGFHASDARYLFRSTDVSSAPNGSNGPEGYGSPNGSAGIDSATVRFHKDFRLRELTYETAESYDPHAFGVKHRTVRLGFRQDDAPSAEDLVFDVISWNHMFFWNPDRSSGNVTAMVPEYFSSEQWKYYRMFKPVESLLARNRAHPEFAREAVAPAHPGSDTVRDASH